MVQIQQIGKERTTWDMNTGWVVLSLFKKKIWKNIHTAEKDYATKFEQHGYGMVMQHIAEATKGSDYTKFSPAKIKKILDELGEERRATVAKLQEGVKEPWANKREDLHKEYDKL